MASEAAIEIVNSITLKEDVTRSVLEHLGVTAVDQPGKGSKGRPRANVFVSSDAGRIVVQGKAVTGEHLVSVIGEALDQYLGQAGQVFLLSSSDLSPVIARVMAQVPHAVRARKHAISEAQLDALVDIYLPHDPLAGPLSEIERDNAEAQARFIETVPCYSADEIAKLAGHEASNRSATATRWKAQGAIFGVRRLGRDRYAAFQFQDGRPRKIIAKVLKALPSEMSPWQTALWFSTSNGWLDGAAPMDRLADESALLAAATQEAADWVG